MANAKLYLGGIEIGGGDTLAAFMAGLTGDWCDFSDSEGITGQILSDVIGVDFDDYKDLGTIAEIADEPGAVSEIESSIDALDLLSRSTTAVLSPLSGELSVGTPFAGGFLSSIIDSGQVGAIPAGDYSQVGQKYRIVDLGSAGESPSTIQYKTANTDAPAECSTVWNGLSATQAMISAGAAYPAAMFAAGFKVPDNGASDPYIPAMWELIAMYWDFKPFTNNNYLTAVTGSTFPGGTVEQGFSPIVVPQRPKFTASVPAQTPLLPWRTGNAQAFQAAYYWCSTEYSAALAWRLVWATSSAGRLAVNSKSYDGQLRLVRRIPLSA